MDSSEERSAVSTLTRYTVGDLVYTSDDKTMGLIKEIKQDGFVNEYKIDFHLVKCGIPVPAAWRSEWWKETSIQARVISKKWIVQRRMTSNISESSIK